MSELTDSVHLENVPKGNHVGVGQSKGYVANQRVRGWGQVMVGDAICKGLTEIELSPQIKP